MIYKWWAFNIHVRLQEVTRIIWTALESIEIHRKHGMKSETWNDIGNEYNMV